MYTIAIDAMGGDHGPKVTVPAALQVLKARDDIKVILVGNEETLEKILSRHSYPQDRCVVRNASQTVAMDEPISQAMRKRDSAMRVAVDLVKAKEADACVSAGNTGALMATARFVLKTIDGVSRPAIVVDMPTLKPGKTVRVLDLGANVDCTADHLVQFAIMASTLVTAVDGIESPSIGLLNIGEEEIKGNETVKQAAEILNNISDLNYQGYIEGDQVFQGDFDVVVCDGFVGNIFLKSCEGLVKFMGQLIRRSAAKSFLHKLALAPAMWALKDMREEIDPRNHNGTIFIGLNGVVVKSHGKAKVHSYANAIEAAIREAEKNVPERVAERVSAMLKEIG